MCRGRLGPLITVCVLDGNSVNNAMGELLEGRHELVYTDIVEDDGDVSLEELRDSDIFVRIRCKIHAPNKGVEWGLKP